MINGFLREAVAAVCDQTGNLVGRDGVLQIRDAEPGRCSSEEHQNWTNSSLLVTRQYGRCGIDVVSDSLAND